MSNGLHPCSISSKESENTLVLQPIPSRIGITTTNGITMTNAIIDSIVSRSSTKYFDPAVALSDDQIRELVRIGTTAPTSFHLQNWRFIAVRTPEAKARLCPLAWHQPAITAAAVTFIVCGQLADSSVIPERLAPLVEAGIMPAKMVPEWEIPARDLYMEYPHRHLRRGGDDLCGPRAGPGFDADDRFRCRGGGPRVRTGRGRSAGHAVVRGGGASQELAAEAAPSGGRCAGIRIVEGSAFSPS